MSKKYAYNGSTAIQFMVERVIDPITKNLRFVKNVPIELEVQVIELLIEGAAYFLPGVKWKKPDNCYPDESETVIDKITDSDSKVWDESDLSKSEYELVLKKIESSIQLSNIDYGD